MIRRLFVDLWKAVRSPRKAWRVAREILRQTRDAIERDHVGEIAAEAPSRYYRPAHRPSVLIVGDPEKPAPLGGIVRSSRFVTADLAPDPASSLAEAAQRELRRELEGPTPALEHERPERLLTPGVAIGAALSLAQRELRAAKARHGFTPDAGKDS